MTRAWFYTHSTHRWSDVEPCRHTGMLFNSEVPVHSFNHNKPCNLVMNQAIHSCQCWNIRTLVNKMHGWFPNGRGILKRLMLLSLSLLNCSVTLYIHISLLSYLVQGISCPLHTLPQKIGRGRHSNISFSHQCLDLICRDWSANGCCPMGRLWMFQWMSVLSIPP
jgi:hypothetical protein